MKWLEYFGTGLAGFGFMLLSIGHLSTGFGLGLLSCLLLIPVFYKNKLFALLTLQAYFAIINVIGIANNI